MKLRPPAIPLATIDPYFSLWSRTNELNASTVAHWTGSHNTLIGTVTVDGKEYCFMGDAKVLGIEKIKQVAFDFDAMSTYYAFESAEIGLEVIFTSPLPLDDPKLYSTPISYISVSYYSVDGEDHKVTVSISASEELCLDKAGQSPVVTEKVEIEGLTCMSIANSEQKPLNRSGDDLRIDWGKFLLAVPGEHTADTWKLPATDKKPEQTLIRVTAKVDEDSDALFLLAYDDLGASIQYFGETLGSVWNAEGEKIEDALVEAAKNYDDIYSDCVDFSDRLYQDAFNAGGEEYAEMLSLAYRQVCAAHKLVLDKDGELLYISKECFSNGCAATVDVSYPSTPMFLIYNPELVNAMMRPIFKYANSDVWPFDFAPHDAGQYPLVNGQVYSNGTDPRWQMPVEECGNMIIMVAAAAVASMDFTFAEQHMPTLAKWVEYLVKFGADPDNQLCTDDFSGHMAHNVNLSAKAIMGIACYGLLCSMLGDTENGSKYSELAAEMGKSWVERAANEDGSLRLGFDLPGTFSLKYNTIWDKLFGFGVFPKAVLNSELYSYREHENPYGVPLDNRATFTKSDWLVWTAALHDSREEFARMVSPLWKAYHYSPSRVPMTDWYDTVTSMQVGFQHRTVQGGLFIRLLDYLQILNF